MESYEILHEWKTAQHLEPRQKYQTLKQLCTEIISNIKNDSIEPQHIDSLMAMLTVANRIGGVSTRYSRAKSQLLALKVKDLGVDLENVQTLAKKGQIISLESAAFGIGDPDLIEEQDLAISEKTINEKRRFYFSTGADGRYKLTLRVVDISTPVLGASEYKKVLSSTDVSQIEIRSGELYAGDGYVIDKKRDLILTLEPGLYNVSAFLLGGKSGPTSYVAVLGKTTERSSTLLDNIELLEFVG